MSFLPTFVTFEFTLFQRLFTRYLWYFKSIATHVPNRVVYLPFTIIYLALPFSTAPIIHLDDFTILWFMYALPCIASNDTHDLMSYCEESSMSCAFSSMSCILLNSTVIPLHSTSFCKEGLKAAISCLLNK